MQVKILGAGVGSSHYLKAGKHNNFPPGFLIEWNGKSKLLFECSQGVNERLEMSGIDYASIHHIAISHPHPDHCVPIPFIQAVYLKGFLGGEQFKNPALNLYGPDYLIENFQTLWNIYTPDRKNEYFEYPTLILTPMSQGDKQYQVENAVLTAKKVHHGSGKCDAVSYRLETSEGIIVYSGDTGDCDGIRQIAKRADIFICEVSARIGQTEKALSYGHLTPYQAGDIAKQAGIKKLILFHYTELDNEEAMREDLNKSGFTGEVIFGKDFQDITI